ncbi:uncharacterized protein BBA_01997 [Beauveria bassiana ARSEF 2860]|uniref:Uncharacterized protein n=1 Tax=Beauveria bassiana (strain ARSEF 2860) TaxID=655819 RepID=J4UT57_BEAB2|nr:uncharacterized protein BBA_01997 [Beauveria bassiana ARSEF 2860]EJP68962.1 hypothetical protein BBA_01997 [Beauveria bassiana ARSEF 2860]
MHFVASLVAVGSAVSLASAGSIGFEFPASVPLSKRQTSGPAYECHANCGYAIQDSAKEGYCSDAKWKSLLSNCLDCALTYDIWKHYGTKVGAAAEKCGFESTPKPSGGAGSAAPSEPAKTDASAPASSAPASSAPASSAPATQSSAASQPSAPGQTSQSATAPQTTASQATGSSQVHSTSAATTTAKPTASASHTAGNNTTSTQIQVGAANMQKPAMLAAGAVALFAVNMI